MPCLSIILPLVRKQGQRFSFGQNSIGNIFPKRTKKLVIPVLFKDFVNHGQVLMKRKGNTCGNKYNFLMLL
jgi:hypothetical protein